MLRTTFALLALSIGVTAMAAAPSDSADIRTGDFVAFWKRYLVELMGEAAR